MSNAYNASQRLLDRLAETLLQRIESGEASSQDLNVARQFLKDNKIECVPTKDNAIGQMEQGLLNELDKEFDEGSFKLQ